MARDYNYVRVSTTCNSVMTKVISHSSGMTLTFVLANVSKDVICHHHDVL